MRRLFLSSASALALTATAYSGSAQADVWENIADNYGEIDANIYIAAGSITGGSYPGLQSTFGVSALNEGKIIGATADSTIEVGTINVLSYNLFDDDVFFSEDVFEEDVFGDDVVDVVLEFAQNSFTARNTAYNNSDQPIDAQIEIDVENNINNSFGGLSTQGFGAINQDSSITIEGGDVDVDVGSSNILSFNTFNDDVDFDDEVFDEEVVDGDIVDLDFGGTADQILLENFVANPGPSGDGTINAFVDIDATNIVNGSFSGAPVQVDTDDSGPGDPVPIFENFVIKTQGVAAQNGGEITATFGAVDIDVGDFNLFSSNTVAGEMEVDDDLVQEDVFESEIIDIDLDLGELTARNYAYNSVEGDVQAYVNIWTEEDIVNSFNTDGTIGLEGSGNPATVIQTQGAGAINNGAITVGWGDVDVYVGDISVFSDNTFEKTVDFDDGDAEGVFDKNVFDEAIISINIDLDDGQLILRNYADNEAVINAYVEINNTTGSGDIVGSFNTIGINLGESTVISTSGVGAVNQGATDPENPDEVQPATIEMNFGSVSASVGDLNVFSGNDFQGDLLFGDIFEDDVFNGDPVIEIEISWDGMTIENRAENSGNINAYVDIGTEETVIKDSFTDGLALQDYPELSNGIQTSGIGALNNGEINIAVGSVSASVDNINVFSDNSFNSNGGDPTFTEDLFKNEVFSEEVIEAEDAEGVAVNASVGNINLVSNNSFYGPVNFNSNSTVFDGDVFGEDVVDANFAVVDSLPSSSTTYQNIAYNTGNIEAAVTIDVASISGSFSSIGTSAIGASNIGTISFTPQQLP